MLLSLDKLSLRDSSTAATEGERLTGLQRPKASRDRTSDGDTEEEEEEDDEDDDDEDKDGDAGKKEALKNTQNDEVSFWAWRLRPAALCELRQYLAFRLAKAARPTTGPDTVTTNNECKNGKRTMHLSRPIPNLLRRLTCTRGIETEPLTPSTPPSTASSSPATKRPKSLAHRHCLRIRGSQARSLVTGPHPSLGQVFDPARTTARKPPEPPSPPQGNASAPLLKPFTSTSNSSITPPHTPDSKTTNPNFRSPSKNGSVSSETEPDSDVAETPRIKPILLPRRPAVPPPPPPTHRNRKYGSSDGVTLAEMTPHVRLLELPAHHQPLLHRYGLSQFVLVLDDQNRGPLSSASPSSSSSSSSSYRNNPLRSVMRKPHVNKGSKKSVTFQEVTSVPNTLRIRETRIGVLSGR